MQLTLVSSSVALILAVASAAAIGQASPALQPASGRGQLLYETHCIRCHATQVHWRDARSARNWTTLRAEVERWQRQSGQQWPDEDIDAVARYLNETIYRYPEPKERG